MIDKVQPSRRNMLTGLAALSALQIPAASAKGRRRLLVLGGTHFVGPAIVQSALAGGYEVTLFNRGKTNPSLFPQLEKIRGDREPATIDLSGLRGRRKWDAVIDVWPSNPDIVEATGRLLKGRVGSYVYVSSISAYQSLAKVGVIENDPLFDDASNKAAWYEYGKAESERRLIALYGDNYASVRPSSIAGYRQDSDAFRFWSIRIARGGDVLAPGDGNDPVQFIDVMDVGAFTVGIIDRGLQGSYNLAGPNSGKTTFREMLDRLNRAHGNKANLLWVSTDFLMDGVKLRPRADIPLWVPLSRATRPGFMQVDTKKAIGAGLTFRMIEQTAADELRWFKETMPIDYEFGHTDRGITKARELEVLTNWRRSSNPAGDGPFEREIRGQLLGTEFQVGIFPEELEHFLIEQ